MNVQIRRWKVKMGEGAAYRETAHAKVLWPGSFSHVRPSKRMRWSGAQSTGGRSVPSREPSEPGLEPSRGGQQPSVGARGHQGKR